MQTNYQMKYKLTNNQIIYKYEWINCSLKLVVQSFAYSFDRI